MAADQSDPFLVPTRRGVLSNLRAIVQQGTLLHMRLRSHPEALVTTLLQIDPDNERIVVDASADRTFNDRMQAPGEVQFSTVIDGVRVQFDCIAPARPVVYDGRPALELPLPHQLRRIQRRDHFRIDIPVSTPLWCEVSVDSRRTESLKVRDISAGGIALFDPSTLIEAVPGTLIHNGQLPLPELGTVNFTLNVRRVGITSVPGGATTRILACQFQQLSPSHEIMVRNYIGQLERMLLARRKGFD